MFSNQVGLANIAAKYRLLNRTLPGLMPAGGIDSEPVVGEDDGYFTVTLPLFAPAS